MECETIEFTQVSNMAALLGLLAFVIGIDPPPAFDNLPEPF
jgi:hypothetical protein